MIFLYGPPGSIQIIQGKVKTIPILIQDNLDELNNLDEFSEVSI